MPIMDRRKFIKTTSTATLGGFLALNLPLYGKNNTTSQPNILFVYADQFRRPAMEFWSKPAYKDALNGTSDPVITPNLNKLADEGIVFTQAVSTHPVCSPYRGMMMSGMFPEQNGIKENCYKERNVELKQDATCLTDVLFNEGYNTAYFGKAHWHKTEALFDENGNYVGTTTPPGGNYVNNYDTYVPAGASRHSIEYWYQALKDSHKDPYIYSSDPNTINGKSDGELHRPQIYSPLNEANHIIDYIKNTDGQRDTEKPFCAVWALNPPHSPYASINDCDEEAYNLYYKDKDVQTLLNRPNVTTNLADDKVKYYFANVTGVDKQIGRVLDSLESAGLKENTIVVFTSDHGEMMGSQNKMSKNNEYEESFGIPFLISYPSKLSHRIENLLLGTTDIMPTLLGLAGIQDKIPAEVEGTDYSPIFLDSNTEDVAKPKSALYLSKSNNRGIKTDKYTFSVDKNGNVSRLFDNVNDPYQLTNLEFSSLPETEQIFLLTELGNWLAKANDFWYQEKKFANFIIYPTSTSVENNSIENHNDFELYDNYPNPFNPSTNIKLKINDQVDAELNIYNSNGQLIKNLHKGNLNSGIHTFKWDGKNTNNTDVASGVYYYKFQTDKRVEHKKMQLLR